MDRQQYRVRQKCQRTSYTIAVYTDKNNNMTTGQQTIEHTDHRQS
ncbi:MAG: hypothetical protein ACLSH6_08925 [Limosilactobacillus pontis]